MICGLIESCARQPISLCLLNPAQPCSTLLNPAKLCPRTRGPVSRGARPRTHPVVVRELDVPLAHGLADLGLNVHVQQRQEARPVGLLRCPLQPLHFVLQGRDRRVLGPQLASLLRRRPPPPPCDLHISVRALHATSRPREETARTSCATSALLSAPPRGSESDVRVVVLSYTASAERSGARTSQNLDSGRIQSKARTCKAPDQGPASGLMPKVEARIKASPRVEALEAIWAPQVRAVPPLSWAGARLLPPGRPWPGPAFGRRSSRW